MSRLCCEVYLAVTAQDSFNGAFGFFECFFYDELVIGRSVRIAVGESWALDLEAVQELFDLFASATSEYVDWNAVAFGAFDGWRSSSVLQFGGYEDIGVGGGLGECDWYAHGSYAGSQCFTGNAERVDTNGRMFGQSVFGVGCRFVSFHAVAVVVTMLSVAWRIRTSGAGIAPS